jgi:hypothetical protein
VSWTKYSDAERFDKIAEAQTKRPPLARTRVNNFWGGVHKNFEVAGEGKYFVRVANNFCFCTILSSVCVDKISGQANQNNNVILSQMQNVPYYSPVTPSNIPDKKCRIANENWLSLNEHTTNAGALIYRREFSLRILQTVKNSETPAASKLYSTFAWQLNLWENEQKNKWNDFINEAWKRTNLNEPEKIKSQNSFLNNPKQNPWTGWLR